MYIQISSKCNMTCAHCCYNCTNEGTNMSWKVFKAACDFAQRNGYGIFIGGGEPTLHPRFFEMLGYALTCHSNDSCGMAMGVITNGSITESALRLATMARNGIIYAGLSQDEFHDPIDPVVVKVFTKNNQYRSSSDSSDFREIRRGNKYLSFSGRAKELIEGGGYVENGCVCSEIMIRPNGDVYTCGCEDAPLIGNILDKNIHFEDNHECYKDIEKEQEVEEVEEEAEEVEEVA